MQIRQTDTGQPGRLGKHDARKQQGHRGRIGPLHRNAEPQDGAGRHVDGHRHPGTAQCSALNLVDDEKIGLGVVDLHEFQRPVGNQMTWRDSRIRALMIRDRVNDAQAKLIITQDGAYRRGSVVPLKPNVDNALEECPSVKHVIVLRRAGNADQDEARARPRLARADRSAVRRKHEARSARAEHPLFILYTSGSTGKPKGVLHTTAGYLLGAHAHDASTSSICTTTTSTGAPPTSAGSPATATSCTARSSNGATC